MRRRLEIVDDPLADEVKIPRCHLLDTPTPPHPILDALMHSALLRIMLTADGATPATEPRMERTPRGDSGTALHPSRIPHSALAREVDALWIPYVHAGTHRKRLALIREAQGRSDALLYAPDRSKVRNTKEWREAISADPRPCRVVAQVYGVHYSTVSRIKKGVARIASDATALHTSQAA